MIQPAVPRPYTAFIRLFNEERFFEAHEILEGLWREDQSFSKDFYHGLIQIAAAFVHIQKNNPPGARELFRTASGYLEKYLPAYMNLPLDQLLAGANQCIFGQGKFPRIYLFKRSQDTEAGD